MLDDPLSIVLVGILGIGAVGSAIVFPIITNVEDKSKAEVEVLKKDQTIDYGDHVDLSNFKVTGHAILGDKTFNHYDNEINYEMITYNPDFIGTQIATFKHEDKEVMFNLTINPKQLDVPVPVYNSSMVDWDDVPGASHYEITINDSSYIIEESNYSLAEYVNPGNLSIKVRSYSDSEKYLSSSFASLPTLTILNHTNNITYDGNTFHWDEVEYATGYLVTVNDIDAVTTSASYSFNSFKDGANVITVTALGGNYALPSAAISKTYTKLPKVSDLFYHVSTSKIMWAYESTEVTFDIYVDGEYVASTGHLYYEYPLDFSREHLIKVCAKSLKEEMVDSDLCSIEIPIRKLSKPDVAIKLGSYVDTYRVEVTGVDKADTYDLSIVQMVGSEEHNSHYVLTSELFKEITIKPGANKIIATVYAIDSTGYYINSESTIAERIIS